MVGEPLGEIQRRRATDISREVAVHFFLKFRVGLGGGVGLFQLQNVRHQRLGDKAAAIDAEMAALVGAGAERIGQRRGHAFTLAALRAARMKARILSGSLTPGLLSTPDDTSTPGALVMAIACATLPASSPADSMKG